MKHNWEYKKLGEVCEVLNGYAFKSSNYIEDNGLRIIRITNVQDGEIIDDDPKFYPLDQIEELSKYILKKDDLLISLTGNVGRVGLISKSLLPAALNQRVACLRSTTYIPRFLFWYFRRSAFQDDCIKSAKGVAQLNMSTEWLKEYYLPILNAEMQERIVAELDKINEVIEECRELLRTLDSLAQSIFYDTFGDPISNPKGWPIRQISEIGEIERGTGISKKDFVANGSPCIHYGQLHTAFGPTAHKHLTCIPKNLLSKPKIAHPRDVIMAITSEDVEGSCKSTAWLGDYDIIVGSDAAILHHNQNGVYISYYTLTSAFSHEKAKYAKGFKVTHISSKEIGSIPIMVPPLSLQQQFAAQIEAVEAQKNAVEATISEMKTLLDSRMDYWFND